MLNNYKFFCILTICSLIYLGLMAPPSYGVTPYETLQSIEKSVDQANGEDFLALVDVDSIIGKCLDTFIDRVNKPEVQAQLPPLLALMFSQAADKGQKGTALRGLMRQETRAFIINAINTGAFAGKKLNNVQTNGLLAPLFANASIGKKEIRGTGDAIKDGNDYLLPFTVFDYGNGYEYPVVARFVPAGDGWRMTAIENLDQLFGQIGREAIQAD